MRYSAPFLNISYHFHKVKGKEEGMRSVVEWLGTLVSLDTTSRDSNLEFIRLCKEYLEKLGANCTLVHNEEKTKANLWATLPGEGGVTEGGIILSGHTDAVPVDGQKWDTDPFKMTEKSGKLYGRGTCDMKGFIAVCMSLAPKIAKMQRKRPVHFAWTYDEEVGCIGGRVLAEYLKANNIRADGCLVGEPTSNKVIIAHKGLTNFRVRVYGKAAHSSYALTNQGCNAIDYACRLVLKIREVAEALRLNGPFDRYFDVAHTTISTNLIQGGNAVNIIPAVCEFTYEIRNLPFVLVESVQLKIQAFVDDVLLPSLQKEYPGGRIDIEQMVSVPPLKNADEKDPFTLLLRRLTRDSTTRKVAYATEGGHYQDIGIPVIICGPGSILQAHQPNEYVELDQLDEAVKIVWGIIQAADEAVKPHL